MKVDYSSVNNRLSLSFPKCGTADKIYEITVRPEHGGPTVWIKQIEDNHRGILFSDGTFTAGRKHCTSDVRKWLAECEERRKNPFFNFALDEPASDVLSTEETTLNDAVKGLLIKSIWPEGVVPWMITAVDMMMRLLWHWISFWKKQALGWRIFLIMGDVGNYKDIREGRE